MCANSTCINEVREDQSFVLFDRHYCSLNCLHAGLMGRAR